MYIKLIDIYIILKEQNVHKTGKVHFNHSFFYDAHYI